MKKIFLFALIFSVLFVGLANAGMLIQAVASGGSDSALYTAATEIWDFNNDATAVKDSGHNLSTGAGTPTYASTGPDGSSHYLDLDNSSYLTLTDDNDFDVGAADYSISVWVRFDSDADDGVVGKGLSAANPDGGGWSLYSDYITDDRYLATRNSEDWTQSVAATTWGTATGTWYHVVVAYDDDAATEVTVWISSSGGSFGDTLNAGNYNQDTSPDVNSQALFVGFDDQTDAIMGGDIDELVFFNGKALNATEAEAIYDGDWR